MLPTITATLAVVLAVLGPAAGRPDPLPLLRRTTSDPGLSIETLTFGKARRPHRSCVHPSDPCPAPADAKEPLRDYANLPAWLEITYVDIVCTFQGTSAEQARAEFNQIVQQLEIAQSAAHRRILVHYILENLNAHLEKAPLDPDDPDKVDLAKARLWNCMQHTHKVFDAVQGIVRGPDALPAAIETQYLIRLVDIWGEAWVSVMEAILVDLRLRMDTIEFFQLNEKIKANGIMPTSIAQQQEVNAADLRTVQEFLLQARTLISSAGQSPSDAAILTALGRLAKLATTKTRIHLDGIGLEPPQEMTFSFTKTPVIIEVKLPETKKMLLDNTIKSVATLSLKSGSNNVPKSN